MSPVYLDCNASNPIDPRVLQAMLDAYRLLPGNAGSPHVHGHNAKDAVHGARDRIGRVVGAKRNEVFFTSGATLDLPSTDWRRASVISSVRRLSTRRCSNRLNGCGRGDLK